jgi:protoheme IX farnesyltransferase
LFFCTVLYLAIRSAPASPQPTARVSTRDSAAAGVAVSFALVGAVAVYFQMVLGGLVRHSGAALACLDIPLCRGSLWPDAHPTVLVQALHRLGAATVALIVLASSIVSFRAAGGRPFLRVLSLAAPALVAGADLARSARRDLVPGSGDGRGPPGRRDRAARRPRVGLALGFAPARRETHEVSGSWSSAVADLVTLAKPRITALVMATFAGGMWLAPGHLPRWRAFMTLLGTALIVGAANALNMFIERDVDKLMARTAGRPLPQGRLSSSAALVFGTSMVAIALPLLLLAGNLVTGVLGGLAFISYVAIYTPMKRTSSAALFVGAVPGALPPLMGWTAVTGRVDAGALALFGILFLWQIPHFLAIAIYRSDDYGRAGFEILPLSIGDRPTRFVIVASSAALVAASLLLGSLHVAGAIYSATAALLGICFILCGLAGLRRAASRLWARSLFFASLVYLTLLFAALIVDRALA